MFGTFNIMKLNLFNVLLIIGIIGINLVGFLLGEGDPTWIIINIIEAFAFGYFNAGYLAPVIPGSSVNWAFFWGFAFGVWGFLLYALHIGLSYFLNAYNKQKTAS